MKFQSAQIQKTVQGIFWFVTDSSKIKEKQAGTLSVH